MPLQPEGFAPPRPIEQILDLARWAPSGDNTQPWRFEIVSDRQLVVHGFDTRDHCVYDLDGHGSHLALGALLETITIAASGQSLYARCNRRPDAPEIHPTFDVMLEPAPGGKADALLSAITRRSVQRRPMPTTPLSMAQKHALETSVAGQHCIMRFVESFGERLSLTKLLYNNAKLRLTMPEAYEVHREIIQWRAHHSPDKVPDQTLGVDPITLSLMRWAMQSWRRIDFLNTYLGGHILPRIEMDFIPGLACAAHFVVFARDVPRGIDDHVAAGRAMQRLWLTATSLGLNVQPEMTPLIFARYVREGRRFTRVASIEKAAVRLASGLERILGSDIEKAVFMGRIGGGPLPLSRSLRLPLAELLVKPAPDLPSGSNG